MSHIKFFKDISKNNVAIAGGKGASLGEMTKAKIPVPPGFVVLANAFDRFIEETNLKEEIKARLAEVDPEDTNTVDRASNVLRDSIHDTPVPKDLQKEILEAFDELFSPTPSVSSPSGRGKGNTKKDGKPHPTPPWKGEEAYVAVRSSATAEDSAVASWAGELETFLNITRKNVVDAVRQCWSSLFTPRAIFYRHEKNLIDHYVSVAVVVQKMVQSEISGVAFTVHPVTEDPDQMIIEAGYGLGEAIVSGQITPDSYIVTKSDLGILDINIGAQTRKLVKSKVHKVVKFIKPRAKTESDGANTWVDLPAVEGERQKLTGKQIIEAAKLFKKIEEHCGFPCDIEWALEKNKFYITQSRPITTLKKII